MLIAASTAAVGSLAYLGIHWVTHSPRFAIASADVTGAERVPGEQIERVLSGVRGENVLRTELATVERELEALPWIESAEVSRELPDRLTIEVREHQPSSLLSLGGLYLADAEGRPFKRAAIEVGEGKDLPVITGLTREDYARDQAATEAAIRRAQAVLHLYQVSDARPKIGEINVDAAFGYTLITADAGARIVVGHGADEVISSRLRRFDLAWNNLSEDERASARAFFLDNTTRTHSVTVALKQ